MPELALTMESLTGLAGNKVELHLWPYILSFF